MKHLSPALTVLVLILTVLTFASCKTTASEQAENSEVEATMGQPIIRELADTRWAIQTIDDKSVVVAPDAATLEFLADGQLAGNASCNRMVGSYERGRADGEITLKPSGLTMMMCPEEIMEQEKHLLEMLPKITSYVRDGAFLTLQTEDERTITARLMEDKPSAELVGEAWFIQDINGEDVIEGSPASLTFSADGKVSGDGSCNNMKGTYKMGENGEFSFELGDTTKLLCPEELMKQDKNMLEIFKNVTSYSIDSTNTLTLTTEDGNTLTARRR